MYFIYYRRKQSALNAYIKRALPINSRPGSKPYYKNIFKL